MFILGLTGSLGMGKSTTAGFFAEAGVPVHDADAVVHRLYEGEAVAAIEAAFPGTTVAGKVDRSQARGAGARRSGKRLRRLEAIVHPLVRAAEARFLSEAQARGAPVVVLDIPLLLETAGDRRVDAIVVVSAPSRDPAAAGAGAARDDRGKIRRPAGPPDTRRREAPAGGFCGGYVAGIRCRARAGARNFARGCYNAEAAAVIRLAPHQGQPCARSCSIPKPPASIPIRVTG